MKKSMYKLLGMTLSGMVLCGLSTVNVSADTMPPTSVENEKADVASGEIQPAANTQSQEVNEAEDATTLTNLDKEVSEVTTASDSPPPSAPEIDNQSINSPAVNEVPINKTEMRLFTAEVIQVATEQELREAVENAAGPVTIELTSDITMTDPYPNHPGGLTQPYPAMLPSQYGSERAALFIDVGKDITLTGAHKLIGTGSNTITIHGRLTLDGPIITHKEGTSDSSVGIRVGNALPVVDYIRANPRAFLHFKSGEVCGNSFVGIVATYGDILMTGGKIHGNGTFDDSYVGGGILLSGNGRNQGISEEAKFGGTAIIQGGEIFDNKAVYGAGIYLSGDYHVSLEISGGNIHDNEAKYRGGGIYSSFQSEKFKISSGSIYNNKAGYYGGGAYVTCELLMTGGEIYGNTARYYGGGIYSKDVLNITGGEIRGNEAESGGGIFTTDHNNLTIGANVKFSGNTASKLTQLLETDGNFAVYRGKISVPDGKWSVYGVKYGYNNYDINFDGSEVQILSLTFLAGEGGSLSGVTEYPNIAYGTLFGQIVLPEVQAAEGYEFVGWSPQLPSGTDALTASATYTALFVKKSLDPEPDPEEIVLPRPTPDPDSKPKPEPENKPTEDLTTTPKPKPTPPAPAPKPIAVFVKTTPSTPAAGQALTKLPATGEKENTLASLLGFGSLLGTLSAYKLRGKKYKHSK